MGLTGHELTAASSVVAALAIVGGYLGVRAANHNALRIAREERSSRRQDEFDNLKRATYAKFLAALTELSSASLKHQAMAGAPELRGYLTSALRRREEALAAARNAFGELEIVAPERLREMASPLVDDAGACTGENQSLFTGEVARLRLAMRYDLRGGDAAAAEVTRTPRSMTGPSRGPGDKHPGAALPAGNRSPAPHPRGPA